MLKCRAWVLDQCQMYLAHPIIVAELMQISKGLSPEMETLPQIFRIEKPFYFFLLFPHPCCKKLRATELILYWSRSSYFPQPIR